MALQALHYIQTLHEDFLNRISIYFPQYNNKLLFKFPFSFTCNKQNPNPNPAPLRFFTGHIKLHVDLIIDTTPTPTPTTTTIFNSSDSGADTSSSLQLFNGTFPADYVIDNIAIGLGYLPDEIESFFLHQNDNNDNNEDHDHQQEFSFSYHSLPPWYFHGKVC